MTTEEPAAQRTDRIWQAWNALPDDHPAPVTTIAARLGIAPTDVAAVVYPATTFGPWLVVHEQLEGVRSANAALRAGNDALRDALRDAWRLLDGLDADANNLQLDIARLRRRHHVPLAGLLDD